ncbi:MAG: heterodisulfide reductase-related iron-sulfur binding cluster [Eubacteriales bacterium]|nr:heterodisulfide reductase-related iron-sulfur binding cluster [Eubacteriales bacterium]
MKMEDATAYTARCFNGEPASCSFACPFHLDIRSFLEKAGKGRWTAAYKELRNAVVFPVIVSMLCEQPCRERCQRTLIGDEAIALQELEKAVIKHVKTRKPDAYFIPPKAQSLAVVGAGPAGLSCALNLAQKKYSVTVFDQEESWGGSLREHPCFDRFDEDIALQFSAVDVTFQLNTEITKLEELNGFHAIYLATGRGGDSFGLLNSWEPDLQTTSNPRVFLGGELCGVSLMEGIAQGPKLSKTLEVFLQTGKASGTSGGYDKRDCGHYLSHDDAVPVPMVIPSSEDGYTEEEAKQEAARCFLCDCEICITSCEMLKRFRKKPHRMAVEVFTDSQAATLSSRSITRETYSCNICGYCKSICPEDVDMGALLQFSRTARMNGGIHPPALHDFWLREMDFASTEGFFASAPKGEETCEYAFFPGCQLGASNPEYVSKSYEFLYRNYNAGLILDCCGAPAYWAGDEARMDLHKEKLYKSWTDMGKPTLIFACATCESVFHRFLPEIKRISLYELLAAADEITPVSPFPAASVFDPCAAREDHGMEQSVRRLAQKAGIALRELPEKNRCCGYGGHMRIANPALYDEISRNRAEAGTQPYIAYCVNCREVFALQQKACVHILDMAFGLEAAAKVPSLQEKRDNSLKVKKDLMKNMKEEDFEAAVNDWDGLNLVIGEALQKELDRKLISASDLR